MRLRIVIKYMFALALLVQTSGCGGGGGNTPAVNATGKHPSNWYYSHRIAYINDALANSGTASCRECHGLPNDSSLTSGGITKINCTTNGCHKDGHPPRDIPHAYPFAVGIVHGPVAKTNLIVCQGCHGQTGGAGANPRFNLSMGNFPIGCESANCHNGAAVATNLGHPKPWVGHNTSLNQANACALCHGSNFEGGGMGNGPACINCHKKQAIPAAAQNCASCHDNPPNDADINNFPDYAGLHAKHCNMANLPGVTCSACHNGYGSGTLIHYSRTEVPNVALNRISFNSSYNAKQGTASMAGPRAARVCSNVRCHGGLVTPPWDPFATIATCTECHTSGNTGYNSYFSGKHQLHVVDKSVPCNGCHDMTDKSRHFANLATPGFETAPSTTLKAYINGYVSPGGSCVVPNFPDVFTCHNSGADPKYKWLP